MGASSLVAVLFDAASSLQSFVSVFVGIYILLIIAYIVLAMLQLPYSRTKAGVEEFLNEICRPYLNLFRGRVPTLGPFDLSPMVAIVVLLAGMLIVNSLIGAVL
jgi:YggT family protein